MERAKRISVKPDVSTAPDDSHLYVRKQVAQTYDSGFMRNFPFERFEKKVLRYLDFHLASLFPPFKVFEGGFGTGLYTIPVLRYIFSRGPQSSYFGVDNSPAMLRRLMAKERFVDLCLGDNDINIGLHDLNNALAFPDANFNVLVLAGLLHCLQDAQKSLVEFDRILEPNGYLIIGFKTDNFTRMLCSNAFSASTDDAGFDRFWRKYYELRELKNIPFPSERCRFIYDPVHVNSILQNLFGKTYELQKPHCVKWYAEASYPDMIRTIRQGLCFGVEHGVSPEQRNFLADQMSGWVEDMRLANEEVDIDHCMEIVVWKKLGTS